MRVFKNAWFSRFAAKEAISDDELKAVVKRLEAGQAEADLGGGVFKARMARPGAGKSGGYRVIVFFKSGDRTFFEYAYPKSARANIDEKELRDFKKLAKWYLAMTEAQIGNAISTGKLIEIRGLE